MASRSRSGLLVLLDGVVSGKDAQMIAYDPFSNSAKFWNTLRRFRAFMDEAEDQSAKDIYSQMCQLYYAAHLMAAALEGNFKDVGRPYPNLE